MDLESIVSGAKLYLFDMDGTLYLRDRLFDFTAELLGEIRKQGARYRFITNNSSQSAADYVRKMARLGIRTTQEEYVTSGGATVHFMQKHYPNARLYVCGTPSLKNEFRTGGFAVTDKPSEADAVVLGSDPALSFRSIDDICRILFTRGVPYIATHPDMTLPTEYGCLPDCGALADMIAAATGQHPIFVGKPAPLMPEMAMAACGCDSSETVVIGDRLDTDILSGIRAHTRTILVYSGSSTPETLAASPDKPDVAIRDGGLLLDALRRKARA